MLFRLFLYIICAVLFLTACQKGAVVEEPLL